MILLIFGFQINFLHVNISQTFAREFYVIWPKRIAAGPFLFGGIREVDYEWIDFTIKNPVQTETQSDGRIRKWARIKEEGKHLRAILLEDGETIHNAFFDRDFKEV